MNSVHFVDVAAENDVIFCGNVTTLDLFASSTWSRLHPVHHAHYVDVTAEDGIIFVEMLPRLTYSPRLVCILCINSDVMHIMWPDVSC